MAGLTLWQRLADLLRAGAGAGLVTIVKAEGSSPREVGARMIVTAKNEIAGTIGGGALEWEALARAGRLIADHPDGRGEIIPVALGPQLGQCCGGRITLLVEAFGAADLAWITALATLPPDAPGVTAARADARGIFRRAAIAEPGECQPGLDRQGRLVERQGAAMLPLLLFGAGHVGRALVLALAPLPIAVRWIDPRQEAFPRYQPGNVTAICVADPCGEIAAAPPGAAVAVMTHSHALDLDLVAAALQRPDLAYIGLIGSATKRARFVSRLRESGASEAAILRLTCPIGLAGLGDAESGGKEPAIIAAGIAAQLLQVRAHQAARRAAITLPGRTPADHPRYGRPCPD